MARLTSLSVDNFSEDLHLFRHRGGVTPSQFSEELGQLKHLEMSSVVVDDAFLDALGMLTRLTSLILTSRRTPLDPYLICPRLNNLTELMELTIYSEEPTPVRNDQFPQLCLPKLRRLSLPLSGVDFDKQRALWKLHPCLRTLQCPETNWILNEVLRHSLRRRRTSDAL